MRLRWPRGGSRGQALVEFAIVAPVFFLLLFGVIDLGRYVYVTNAFGQAAREGARYGAVQSWIQQLPDRDLARGASDVHRPGDQGPARGRARLLLRDGDLHLARRHDRPGERHDRDDLPRR